MFDPIDFLGRLAVLVPRPRVNLLLYYGVLGARAAWRAEVVPSTAPHALAEPARDRRHHDILVLTFRGGGQPGARRRW